MAVVINEFEVLPPPAPAPSTAATGSNARNPAAAKPEAKDLAALQRALHAQALRSWAH
jgi:hypothetical protein